MEAILSHAVEIAVIVVTVIGFILKHKQKITAIYDNAKMAYFFVEEVAIQQGLVNKEKIELFKEKFKRFMSVNLHWVTEDNMKMALEFASAFAAKYRSEKQTDEKKAAVQPMSMEESILTSPQGE